MTARPPVAGAPGSRPGGPRLRRLAADFESLRADFSGHPHVTVTPIGPVRPPESYRVAYRGVPGVVGVDDSGVPEVADHHEVEITLTRGYPRERPVVRPLTPLFHPNITHDAFCLQDHWAAEQGLAAVVAKVADMIQYRVVNPQSPLDVRAARWAVANRERLPVGRVDVGVAEIEIGFRRR